MIQSTLEDDSLEDIGNQIEKFPGFNAEFLEAAKACADEFEDVDFRPDIPLLNTVVITGRLGQDPLLRYVGSDDSRKLALTTFSVAVQNDFPDPGGGMQPYTSWFDCEMWGHRAETAAKILQKGLRIGITGQLGVSSYTNKEGNSVEAPVLMVQTYEILQSRSETENDALRRQKSTNYPVSQKADRMKVPGSLGPRKYGDGADSDQSWKDGSLPRTKTSRWQQLRAPSNDGDAEDDGLPF